MTMVKLSKPGKGDPGKGQSICHCPFCEHEVLATVKAPASRVDGAGTAFALIVLLILAMGYLILQNPGLWLHW
jgi:hypothetical protein